MTTEPSKDFMIEAKLRGPGPGRYGLPTTCGTEKHDFTQNRKPAFSFGTRFSDNDMVASPGPVYLVKGKKSFFTLLIKMKLSRDYTSWKGRLAKVHPIESAIRNTSV